MSGIVADPIAWLFVPPPTPSYLILDLSRIRTPKGKKNWIFHKTLLRRIKRRPSREANDPMDDFFSAEFHARMREKASAWTSPGGERRYSPGGGYWGTSSPGRDQRFDGVRVNLFDVFRFGAGERENMGIPKARWELEVNLCAFIKADGGGGRRR